MNNLTNLGLATLLMTALFACQNSNGNSNKNKGQTAAVNPMAKGELPDDKTTFYRGNRTGSPAILTVDPSKKTFTYEFIPTSTSTSISDAPKGTISGNYDPSTGQMTATNCDDVEFTDCEDFNSGLVGTTLPASGVAGKGLVVLVPDGYYGVSRTDKGDMPKSGRVTYDGDFVATYRYDANGDGQYDQTAYTGKATTTVNFNTDLLKAEFTDFTTDGKLDKNMSAKVRNVQLNGNQFGGGEGRVSRPDGTLMAFEAVDYLNGEFFGPKAEELGGVFAVQQGGDAVGDEYAGFFGAWNGVKK